MLRCAQLSVTVLSIVLGVFYCFVGLIKVYPAFVPELHNEMRDGFSGHASVSPFNIIGVQVDPGTYLLSVGVAEIVFGVLLIIGPSALQLLANIGLLVMMVGAVHAHVVQDDGKFLPAGVCFLLLGFRLMLATSFPTYAQIDEGEKKRK